MAALASFVPGFLKRRKRSAEEDEANELRAALNAAGRAAAVEACVELRAANKALTQRIASLERALAARDDAAAQAMRDVVRDELVRAAANLPQPSTPSGGECVPSGDADDAAREMDTGEEEGEQQVSLKPEMDEKEAHMADTAVPQMEVDDKSADADTPVLKSEENAHVADTRAPHEDHLLGMKPAEFSKVACNVFAVSSNAPEAAAWRKDAPVPLRSPRGVGGLPGHDVSIAFFNLRETPIDVLWIGYDGAEKRLDFLSKATSKVRCKRQSAFHACAH